MYFFFFFSFFLPVCSDQRSGTITKDLFADYKDIPTLGVGQHLPHDNCRARTSGQLLLRDILIKEHHLGRTLKKVWDKDQPTFGPNHPKSETVRQADDERWVVGLSSWF